MSLVLIGAGLGILLLEGITKKSVVGGPLLIALGVTWFLHFYFWVQWRYLAPGVLIVAGVLMLIARLARIPDSRRGDVAVPDNPRRD